MCIFKDFISWNLFGIYCLLNKSYKSRDHGIDVLYFQITLIELSLKSTVKWNDTLQPTKPF